MLFPPISPEQNRHATRRLFIAQLFIKLFLTGGTPKLLWLKRETGGPRFFCLSGGKFFLHSSQEKEED
jgi:hypothetical protein